MLTTLNDLEFLSERLTCSRTPAAIAKDTCAWFGEHWPQKITQLVEELAIKVSAEQHFSQFGQHLLDKYINH